MSVSVCFILCINKEPSTGVKIDFLNFICNNIVLGFLINACRVRAANMDFLYFLKIFENGHIKGES